ncbi:MAG: N-acetylglucosamine-6-phosphate deacetylase [Acidobacteria bacterium]|nr:N-acetylglucosamine-6-phosphate deacetylase [Acidobacteriota bacterium]
MDRVNATAIFARQIITPVDDWIDGVVVLRQGQIAFVGTQVPDHLATSEVHSGEYLIPGLIDLHINGAGGADASKADFDSLAKISRCLAQHGVTAFFPTLISDSEQNLRRKLKYLGTSFQNHLPGARALGIHLEGPFLNPEYRGVHPESAIQKASEDSFSSFLDAAQGTLKIITLAPEVSGALDLIPKIREVLPVVSMGHSAADYQTAMRGVEAGINLATHTFNAMIPFHHREPGIIGAILESEISAALIPDGIHLHPAALRLLVRCKGLERLILVSDSTGAAGMPDGVYYLDTIELHVRDGVCRDAANRLAGSSLTLDRGIRNLEEWLKDLARDDLKQIVAMATLQPADLLGLKQKGRIEKDADADLVLLDSELRVQKTWVGGNLVYDAQHE